MDFERSHCVRHSLQRRDGLLGIVIVKDRVTLAESAAFRVLARQADRNAILEDCAEGQLFGCRPIDGLLIDLIQGFPSPVARSLELAVNGKPLG